MRKILGFVQVAAFLAWWFVVETVKSIFFERVVLLTKPLEIYALQFGPPLVFLALALYLFWPQIADAMRRRWAKGGNEGSQAESTRRDEHSRATREIYVSGGGTGSKIDNSGGIGVDVYHGSEGPAERIVVSGMGTGEEIINTGGIGKRIVTAGAGTVTQVRGGPGAKRAVAGKFEIRRGLCKKCGQPFNASRVVQGYVGPAQPPTPVPCVCGNCGETNSI